MSFIQENKTCFWLLILILLLGTFLRVYHIDVPFTGFHASKEVQFANIAQHFQERGNYFVPETDWEGINTNVFLPAWFVLAGWETFGNYEWAARLPFAIMGIISIIIIYFIGKELYNKKTGLLAAFFLAISPMAAYFSRNVQAESPLLLFSLLTIYFFLVFKRTKEKKYFYFSSLSLLIASLNKYIMLYLLFPLILYYYTNKNEFNIKTWKWTIYFLIPAAPTLIYIGYIRNVVATQPTANILSQYYNFVSMGLTNFTALTDIPSIIYRIIHLVGGTNIIAFILSLLYINFIIKNKSLSKGDKLILYWMLGFFMVYISFLNIATPGNNYYLISFIPPICLFASRGLQAIRSKGLFLVLIILSILLSIATLLIIYDVNYPYAEAGKKLSTLLGPGEIFYRIGDSSVCYYSQHQCYASEALAGYKLEKLNYRYLSIGKATFERDFKSNPHDLNYIKENFVLIANITGKIQILNGNTFTRKTEPEYELIYARI